MINKVCLSYHFLKVHHPHRILSVALCLIVLLRMKVFFVVNKKYFDVCLLYEGSDPQNPPPCDPKANFDACTLHNSI